MEQALKDFSKTILITTMVGAIIFLIVIFTEQSSSGLKLAQIRNERSEKQGQQEVQLQTVFARCVEQAIANNRDSEACKMHAKDRNPPAASMARNPNFGNQHQALAPSRATVANGTYTISSTNRFMGIESGKFALREYATSSSEVRGRVTDCENKSGKMVSWTAPQNNSGDIPEITGFINEYGCAAVEVQSSGTLSFSKLT